MAKATLKIHANKFVARLVPLIVPYKIYGINELVSLINKKKDRFKINNRNFPRLLHYQKEYYCFKRHIGRSQASQYIFVPIRRKKNGEND